MKNSILRSIILFWIAMSPWILYGQKSDSLALYLQEAMSNNPQLKADLNAYKSALQQLPQAGAYPDPELEIGFYIKPMSVLSGKQIANFTLMQMFPWFGTKKAASREASEMARMKYQNYRQTLNNLLFSVKSEWYALSLMQDQYHTILANLDLLSRIERLATTQYSDGSSPLSDVLRIQLEKKELTNMLDNQLAMIESAQASFNALLARDTERRVILPDTLAIEYLQPELKVLFDSIIQYNPMLEMYRAQLRAETAKGDMIRRMSYPMFGIGLQYGLVGKRKNDMYLMKDMNGMDMYMPMVKLTLPLYRNKYRAQIRQNEIDKTVTQLTLSNIENELKAELTGLGKQLDNALRSVRLYTEQYTLTLNIMQLMIQEFSVGKSSLSDLLQVERQLLDYRLKKGASISSYNTVIAQIQKLISKQANGYENAQ